MSWICDYCSTANEDRDTECFVCGRERSKESIREAKRAAREERTKRINEVVYKSTTITGKVMCFSSIVLFSVIALIVLYLKMQSGSLGDLVYTGIAIAENIGENFKLLFNINVEAIATQLLDSPLKNIGSNYEAIRLYALNTIQNNGECIITELFVNRSVKYETFSQKFILLKDAIVGAFQSWWTVISLLVVNIGENISSVVYNAEEIVQKIKEPFMQFKE